MASRACKISVAQLTQRLTIGECSRLFSHGAIALIVALTFLNLGNTVADVQYRVFVMFFATVRLNSNLFPNHSLLMILGHVIDHTCHHHCPS